jgi:elongation factor G
VKPPGALIRVPLTLIDEADPARFELALDQVVAADPQVEIKRTPVGQRVILGGASERHLEVTADRLRRDHGLPLQFGAPEIAYLETILRTIDQDSPTNASPAVPGSLHASKCVLSLCRPAQAMSS